jgi:hypothetical protein
MTIEEVRAEVRHIAAAAGDPEAAHSNEDALWANVLRAIAAGVDDAADLAAEALKTEDIRFPRWCA